MNLGSIKDRSGKMLLKKKTVKKAVGAACVCAVAVIAVTAVIAGRDTGEIPTVEAPVETQPAAVTQSAAETQPAASAAPAPATADASVIAAVMAAVGACGAALLSGTRKKSGRS